MLYNVFTIRLFYYLQKLTITYLRTIYYLNLLIHVIITNTITYSINIKHINL